MALFTCSACGAMHRVSIAQSGYVRLPCRKCGQLLQLSEPAESAPTAATIGQPSFDVADRTSIGLPTATRSPQPGTRQCPACGRPILRAASKCRHCLTRFDPAIVGPFALPIWLGGALVTFVAALALWWFASARVLPAGP